MKASLNHHRSSALGRALFTAISLFAASLSASAAVTWHNVQIGGFVSQGYSQSDGNNYPFENNEGTFDFREMALNASTTFGNHLRVGAQAFAERLGNYGEDKILLDWAVVDYNFRQEFGIRAGRVKFPKGLYGEALDLDMLRPFIFLPMAIYNPVMRDFNASFDGALIYGTISTTKAGSFDYKIFYGDIPMNTDQGVADFFNTEGFFAPPGVESIGMDSTSGAQLFWSTPLSGLRVGASYTFLNKITGVGPLAVYPLVDVNLLGDRYSFTTLSAEYVWKSWTFAAEWEQTDDTFIISMPIAPSRTAKTGANNWYASAAYRLNDHWEFGTYYSEQNDRFAAAGLPKDDKYFGDVALSIRYDLNEHILFKVEVHQTSGHFNVLNTERTPNPVKYNDTSYFAVKTTISF